MALEFCVIFRKAFSTVKIFFNPMFSSSTSVVLLLKFTFCFHLEFLFLVVVIRRLYI